MQMHVTCQMYMFENPAKSDGCFGFTADPLAGDEFLGTNRGTCGLILMYFPLANDVPTDRA